MNIDFSVKITKKRDCSKEGHIYVWQSGACAICGEVLVSPAPQVAISE